MCELKVKLGFALILHQATHIVYNAACFTFELTRLLQPLVRVSFQFFNITFQGALYD